MRIWSLLLLTCGVALAGAKTPGSPAVYVVGNLDGIEPGAEGVLTLDADKAVFRSGKMVFPILYHDIHNAELGTKLNPPVDAPVYKIWQLHKRFVGRATHQMLNLEYADKDGNNQTMTFELEEAAAAEMCEALEFKIGKKHRATNGEAWWGDSLWKTQQNHNIVSADPLGVPPAE
jgi:hypothetical protein